VLADAFGFDVVQGRDLSPLQVISVNSSKTVRRSVVVVGAFPPPVNGMSRNIDIVATDLARITDVVRADLSVGQSVRTIGYHLRRSLAALRACRVILRNAKNAAPSLCIAADGQLGLVYTLICVLTARFSGHQIHVQHHSFSPINRHSWLMRLFVLAGGSRLHHVFLCDVMRRRFIERYPGARSHLVSSNARYTPPQVRRIDPTSTVRIGLLSVLSEDKGLYRFIDVLDACRQRNLPVAGLLAGPAEKPADRDAIAAAQRRLGDRLDYVGPLYGADQANFYRSIDVFIFPTAYVNEAQPNVLFEAMSYGAAIISNIRGCIAEDVTPECGLLARPGEDFVASAVAQIAHWCRSPEQLRDAQHASAARLAMLHNAANGDYTRLLNQIAGVCPEASKLAFDKPDGSNTLERIKLG